MLGQPSLLALFSNSKDSKEKPSAKEEEYAASKLLADEKEVLDDTVCYRAHYPEEETNGLPHTGGSGWKHGCNRVSGAVMRKYPGKEKICFYLKKTKQIKQGQKTICINEACLYDLTAICGMENVKVK